MNISLSWVLHSTVNIIAFAVLIVLILGITALLISRKFSISYIPLLRIFGIIVGPFLGLIPRGVALSLFEYARVFGLFIILFAEGHHLWRSLLVKNFTTIAILDTLGLLVTALLTGFAFSLAFHAPFTIGFLFGAIISATDPATLIPLFKQYKVDRDIETVLVTESIFNDPLGIVLTSLALVFVFPEAPSAHPVEILAGYVSLYLAAFIYFIYQIGMSVAIGAFVAYLGYEGIKRLNLRKSPYLQILALTLAFGGFVLGEIANASGFLVTTVIGIFLGNHDDFFHDDSPEINYAIRWHMHFNDILAMISTIFIFVLLGASITLSYMTPSIILISTGIALFIVFVSRPVAVLMILPKWGIKKTAFIGLEGPRGVVPSALASLPLMLGITYNNAMLIHWGEIILSATIITVLLTVIIETLWVPYLRKKLLANQKN